MKVFYHHVPRTGGNFIRNLAEKNYKENFFSISGYHHLDGLYHFLKNKKSFFIYCDTLMLKDQKSKIFDLINLSDINFITTRNPISRFESLYNIWIDHNPSSYPYQFDKNENININHFYLKCKELKQELFLNCQYIYFELYNPQKVINTENLSSEIKNLTIFHTINDEDTYPINHSINKFKLSDHLKIDYKLNYPEDFFLEKNHD